MNPSIAVTLQEAWDAIATPLALITPDGRIAAINRAAAQRLGVAPAPAPGLSLATLLGDRAGDAREIPLSDSRRRLVVLPAPALPDEAAALREQVDLYRRALDYHLECTVLVDAGARILLINEAYEQILGIRSEDVIGKPVGEVIENTRLPVFLSTGVAEIGELQRIRGYDAVVQRIPLKRDGKVVGALGKVMFRDVDEVRQFHERLQMLQSKVEYYEAEMRQKQGASLQHIVGVSAKLAAVRDLAVRAARSRSDVLILGESGVGKELFAGAIHHAGERAGGPFIKVNCAALPADLLEAELFGYADGAFTGAKKGGKPGKFELAHGGTILLDEVGDMSLAMQAKVLRALQEREVERVGGIQPVKVDVRVIAATNRNLEQMVRKGQFRLDLFYRLNVISLTIPPLRERPEDIPPLVSHYLDQFAAQYGMRRKSFAPAAMALVVRYGWPGNARELRNLVERLMHLIDGPRITPDDLPANFRQPGTRTQRLHGGTSLPELMAQTERALIEEALERVAGNRANAATLLGITRSSLYEKLHKHNLA